MKTITIRYPVAFPLPDMPDSRQVLAIGDFDGIHLGHREVIRRAVDTARRLHLPSAIMTFHPHPREVLGHDKYVSHLTPLPAKLEQFEQMGVDVTYIVQFDHAFSRIEPAQFVEEVLVPLGLDTVVVGFDFSFGHRGAGNPDLLCELAAGRFAVEVVRPYRLNGVKVSSTLVRDCLERGDVRGVETLLGRRYTLTGTVVQGDQRGRQIGFPTANIEPDGPFVVPCNGVYAVWVELDGERHAGVMNIGMKPTFEGGAKRTIEAHLFDFSRTIYGKKVKLEFVAFLRPERKFPSVAELVAQIGLDAEEARGLLLGQTGNRVK